MQPMIRDPTRSWRASIPVDCLSRSPTFLPRSAGGAISRGQRQRVLTFVILSRQMFESRGS
eukprot:11197629-Lingulodinium_polyedra.AAC.1